MLVLEAIMPIRQDFSRLAKEIEQIIEVLDTGRVHNPVEPIFKDTVFCLINHSPKIVHRHYHSRLDGRGHEH